MPASAVGDPLAAFSPATAAWFRGAFEAPTPAQAGAWAAVAGGRDALVVAPTGSGKTLAAFLWSLDRIAAAPVPAEPLRRCRVLYVSPLKALAVDVERNLRSPLTGIRREAVRLGLPEPEVTVGIRSGDTPAAERRRLATRPPDVLITTPESLFLILTSAARESLRGVDTVIVDEVHAVAGTKRGAHLALSLERLDDLLPSPARRIGLSATVRPVEEVARFLGGSREVEVVAPASTKVIELEVIVPVDDLGALGDAARTADDDSPAASTSIWPHVEERVVDLVASHRSTLVFANSRRLAERLTARLNEIWHERLTGEVLDTGGSPAAVMAQAGSSGGAEAVLARAHHGSVSKEQRALIEDDLKCGRLPAVVATSSLELGIDMGAVDLVIQVESPPSVASGLQRVGRAGHQVGAVSHGVVLPKFRGDLVQAAVVADRMRGGLIEALRVPRNPLDVLAQQVVAMVSVDDWHADTLLALVRRAAPFAALPDSAFDAVLDMVSGRYPSDEFAELRPRVVWDRATGVLTARPGAQRLAVTSGGTIPDRGLFGVFLVGGAPSSRVGELDEEMVYESRVGDVFTLGASSWRIAEITHDRVLVTPAPGQPGRLPFWHGDSLGRPAELGEAVGAFVREVSLGADTAVEARLAAVGLDRSARGNLRRYLAEQQAATGVVPDDLTLVIERCRDELGDWRLVVHSPYGAQVHAPWAMVVGALVREQFGIDAQVMHADDGLVLRLPDTDDDTVVDAVAASLFLDPDDVERLVTAAVGGSALFAARFRECAARALLLPRRDPGRRSPLWQQRQRSAQLLSVASQYGSFPIVLETVRECLQDVFDVPALTALMRSVQQRSVRIVDVATDTPSPFARSLLFGYVASFLYEGDSPLAERRAQALALDPTLLAELLGHTELRELLDAATLERLELELGRLLPERAARHAEDTADLLRTHGPLSADDAAARGVLPGWLTELELARRAVRVRVAGTERWAAIEDSARLRDALGAPLPVGIPEAFLEPVPDPVGDLVARYARWHGPFTATDVASFLGLGVAVARGTLERLAASGRVVSGDFRPGGSGTEWCDAEVLRTLRRRSVAALRHEIEPVPQRTVGRFLPHWQHLTTTGPGAPGPGRSRSTGGRVRWRGVDGVLAAVTSLAGAALPAQSLESLVLPSRVADYEPAMLDELTAAGEVLWWGLGALPGGDGWVCLAPAELAAPLLPTPGAAPEAALPELDRAVLDILASGGGWFFRDLSARLGAELGTVDDASLEQALWSLVWAGRLGNDTISPLRALASHGARSSTRAPRLRRPPRARRGLDPSGSSLPRRAAMPSRSGPPAVAGRWSSLPGAITDPTVRLAALTDALLHRHGVLTRGAVVAEAVPGGFAAAYQVLRALEEAGRVRRGYVVEGLGASQFAVPGAIDLLRTFADDPGLQPPVPVEAVVLAAADPANPFGAALPWPDALTTDTATGHRPARKAGAMVVLVDGAAALYLERGGRTAISFTADPDVLAAAAAALAGCARDGRLGSVTVEKVDGAPVHGTVVATSLEAAGFVATPRGLRLRRA